MTIKIFNQKKVDELYSARISASSLANYIKEDKEFDESLLEYVYSLSTVFKNCWWQLHEALEFFEEGSKEYQRLDFIETLTFYDFKSYYPNDNFLEKQFPLVNSIIFKEGLNRTGWCITFNDLQRATILSPVRMTTELWESFIDEVSILHCTNSLFSYNNSFDIGMACLGSFNIADELILELEKRKIPHYYAKGLGNTAT